MGLVALTSQRCCPAEHISIHKARGDPHLDGTRAEPDPKPLVFNDKTPNDSQGLWIVPKCHVLRLPAVGDWKGSAFIPATSLQVTLPIIHPSHLLVWAEGDI